MIPRTPRHLALLLAAACVTLLGAGAVASVGLYRPGTPAVPASLVALGLLAVTLLLIRLALEPGRRADRDRRVLSALALAPDGTSALLLAHSIGADFRRVLRCLARLEERGLVESTPYRSWRIYSLTDAGRAALRGEPQ